jgi:hypothetical protein
MTITVQSCSHILIRKVLARWIPLIPNWILFKSLFFATVKGERNFPINSHYQLRPQGHGGGKLLLGKNAFATTYNNSSVLITVPNYANLVCRELMGMQIMIARGIAACEEMLENLGTFSINITAFLKSSHVLIKKKLSYCYTVHSQ